MTTTFGIAAVTTIMRHVVSNRLAGTVPGVGGSVTVTAMPPDRIDLASTEPNQINLYLHQVTPNLGWANVDQPVRDGGGRRLKAPPLVLDLHYLISVYATNPYGAEILLAEMMQEFHDRPVPTREVITAALNPTPVPPNFPTEMAACGLADQVEHIRITPEVLSPEEMSKLWTALQARYRVSVAYQVTTVILASPAPTRRALPVTSTPRSHAFSTAFPEIREVLAVSGRHAPILPGTAVRIDGRDLGAADNLVLVDNVDLSAAVTVRRTERIELALPDPLPAGIAPGAVAVQVVGQRTIGTPPQPRRANASNVAVMVLRPTFTASVNVTTTGTIDGVPVATGTIDLTLAPAVRRDQRVEVALNSLASGRSYVLRAPDGNGIAPPATTATAVSVPFTNVARDDYLVRVRVDAAETTLTVDAGGVFDGPEITL